MPKCPFATWDEISGGLGPFSGGPFKIVHHTTEGSTYAGAKSAFRAHKSDPHFTVTGDIIYQHIDTAQTARALRNTSGGVQTNRDSAVQIEVVGFAGQAKDVKTLKTVAKLCRWIETEHGIPQIWPSGAPRASINGRDPGGHNRNPAKWDTQSGHFGHSQVPENTHWDPAYSAAELSLVTPEAEFDAHEALGDLVAVPDVAEAAATAAAPESAAAIVNRVVEQLLAADAFGADNTVSRLTVRVAAGGVEIEVTVERPDAAQRRPSTRRHAGRGSDRGQRSRQPR